MAIKSSATIDKCSQMNLLFILSTKDLMLQIIYICSTCHLLVIMYTQNWIKKIKIEISVKKAKIPQISA